MAKRSENKYEAKILEKMRVLNAELELLSNILKECHREEKEEKEEKGE